MTAQPAIFQMHPPQAYGMGKSVSRAGEASVAVAHQSLQAAAPDHAPVASPSLRIASVSVVSASVPAVSPCLSDLDLRAAEQSLRERRRRLEEAVRREEEALQREEDELMRRMQQAISTQPLVAPHSSGAQGQPAPLACTLGVHAAASAPSVSACSVVPPRVSSSADLPPPPAGAGEPAAASNEPASAQAAAHAASSSPARQSAPPVGPLSDADLLCAVSACLPADGSPRAAVVVGSLLSVRFRCKFKHLNSQSLSLERWLAQHPAHFRLHAETQNLRVSRVMPDASSDQRRH